VFGRSVFNPNYKSPANFILLYQEYQWILTSYSRQYEVRMATPCISRIHCNCLFECGVHISLFWTPLHLSSQDDVISDRNIHCIHNYGTQYYPDDGGSRFLQIMLHIYQTTRHHIPEDMKLQSLTLESKPHLALETLCIFNQNRTMANVQYMNP
jgi:hypothetical protein